MVENAPFSLGKFGFIINIITVIWIAFAIVLFTMPTAIPVTASSMSESDHLQPSHGPETEFLTL